ncbi:hypothetical protein M440DRAFT_76763 [Trichoderma longibrachiatum ATCC 18648]|uniref:Uncharacterized protein n=1 Tax=Trichoderma longibrachiatum ATCC 18648 TaxID=983965 RepID=A0A2T4CHS1_TRILO|nr:hypothetical protein M440DRAFT_76763 [Trichoderma longibrachiatum ATCC 18648]
MSWRRAWKKREGRVPPRDSILMPSALAISHSSIPPSPLENEHHRDRRQCLRTCTSTHMPCWAWSRFGRGRVDAQRTSLDSTRLIGPLPDSLLHVHSC